MKFAVSQYIKIVVVMMSWALFSCSLADDDDESPEVAHESPSPDSSISPQSTKNSNVASNSGQKPDVCKGDSYVPPDDPLAPPPDVSEPPDDAHWTPSGLATKRLKCGAGAVRPRPIDAVRIHYTGWTTDGEVFDSSHRRDGPVSLPLPRAIEGFREALQMMVVGEIRRMWIVEELAYQGAEGMPEGMLVFDVELIAINE